MGLLRSLGLAGLGTFFLLGLLLSNLVIGVDRTVMDQEFVADALEDEDVYGEVVDRVGDQLGNSSSAPVDPADIVTEEYVERQAEANIGTVYAYLHGERDDLVLRVNTTPLRDRLASELEGQVREQVLARAGEDLERMAANESQYQQVRDEFRNEQLQAIQETTEEELNESELQAAYDERKDTIRQQLLDRAPSGDNLTLVQQMARDLIILRADALLTDMTYSTFNAELNATIDQAAPQLAGQAADRIVADVPTTIDVTERMGADGVQQLRTARKAISTFGLLTIALPLLTLGLAAVIGFLAASVAGAALLIGAITTLAGLVSTVLGKAAQSIVLPELERALSQDAPDVIASSGPGIVRSILETFTGQSIALLVLGLLVLAGGLVLRHRAGEGDDDQQDARSTDGGADGEREVDEEDTSRPDQD